MIKQVAVEAWDAAVVYRIDSPARALALAAVPAEDGERVLDALRRELPMRYRLLSAADRAAITDRADRLMAWTVGRRLVLRQTAAESLNAAVRQIAAAVRAGGGHLPGHSALAVIAHQTETGEVRCTLTCEAIGIERDPLTDLRTWIWRPAGATEPGGVYAEWREIWGDDIEVVWLN